MRRLEKLRGDDRSRRSAEPGRGPAATVSTLRHPSQTPPRTPGAVRPPSLRVAIDVGFPEDPAQAVAAVHVYVSGGRPPVRLHFYVDGDLVASQSGTGMIYDLPAARVPPGHHTVTVRASDALGRWADSSMQLALPLPENLLQADPPAQVPVEATCWSMWTLLARLWR